MNGHVWVMSLRTIAPGEELTYDYNLYDGDEDDATSPEEIARREKAAKRKQAAKKSKAAQ